MTGRSLILQDPTGRRIDVEFVEEDRDGSLTVRRDGTRIRLPAVAIERRDAAHVHLARPLADVAPAGDGEERTIPVVEEHAVAETRERPGSTVRVRTRTEEHEELVEERLTRESVDVERVPIDRYVDAPEPVREEGETTVVPLYEEVLVVEKRLLLKEELRLTKRREERTESHAVRLRTQRADIERDDPDEA